MYILGGNRLVRNWDSGITVLTFGRLLVGGEPANMQEFSKSWRMQFDLERNGSETLPNNSHPPLSSFSPCFTSVCCRPAPTFITIVEAPRYTHLSEFKDCTAGRGKGAQHASNQSGSHLHNMSMPCCTMHMQAKILIDDNPVSPGLNAYRGSGIFLTCHNNNNNNNATHLRHRAVLHDNGMLFSEDGWDGMQRTVLTIGRDGIWMDGWMDGGLVSDEEQTFLGSVNVMLIHSLTLLGYSAKRIQLGLELEALDGCSSDSSCDVQQLFQAMAYNTSSMLKASEADVAAGKAS
ncbi:uncharacterized protein MYCFIDRAFT_208293 [Pseudocercospora fijiensis CIRAD86]|uniref:Uncharacterized protein n=1 Tax=Pseudocercospora fijiensis (strain CIRAD86) TaxID=383855 RepID=M3AUS7_PSEFD|nr:uncharacterized protein MYCFIDRAFT_208293 [Pseudocercospora fijiensis CIRAD86]EME81227.1 hypothetical protein MYCFIDRAFT_208293 [Pseudocercospora fijiensis CIRAD86]